MWICVRKLASKFFKTVADAFSGFTHMRATMRAQKLLQVLTVLGVMAYTVMPQGVQRGPSYFQSAMDDMFNEYLEDANVEYAAFLGIFMDDFGFGTDNWYDLDI